MNEFAEPAICQFYRLIPDAPEPRRADRSADGMLPTEAYRYCEAMASASAFGWYIYPPLNFSLIWDGTEDELVPVAGARQQAQTFDDLGYRYRFDLFTAADHFALASNDEYAPIGQQRHGRVVGATRRRSCHGSPR